MKKKTNQILSICLSLSLAATALSATPANVSAKAKLGTTKMNLYVGQKKQIVIKKKKAKAKYTFSSSSKRKVSVSKKGIVKATKVGKATITVKEIYKKKTRKVGKITVTVKSRVNKSTATPIHTASPTPPATVTTAPTETPTHSPSASPTASPTTKPTRKPTPTPFLENSNFAVPSNRITLYEERKGEVEEFTYQSTAIEEGKTVSRKAMVALPTTYKKTKKYPVVYALHGYNCWYKSMIDDGAPAITWNAASEDEAQDVILVCPSVCANSTGEQTIEAYDNFIHDMTECLMPAIEKEYPVLTGRENTAIWGFSMGGRESLQIGLKRPDLFGYIGAMCPAPGVLDHFADGLKLPDEYKDNTLILIAKGANDNLVGNNPFIYHQELEKNNTPHLYYETMGFGGGGHEKRVFLHGYYNLLVRAFPVTK